MAVVPSAMRTVGVDLSAEPRATAVAVLEWGSGSATVTGLQLGAEDADVLAALDGVDRAALDCPLGWPEPFVEFLTAHRHGHVRVPAGVDGLTWRRTLSRRTTDLACEQLTGVRPLSVAADRIAAVAMRGAGLLSALAEQGRPVDRAGGGLLVETYPAAALQRWGLPHQSYKGASNRAALGQLVDALVRGLPLDLADHEVLCRQSDDALDAVLCALVARAAARGRVTAPPEIARSTVAAEGWIVLPGGALDSLFV